MGATPAEELFVAHNGEQMSFDDAIQRCPFLKSFGETALEEMREELAAYRAPQEQAAGPESGTVGPTAAERWQELRSTTDKEAHPADKQARHVNELGLEETMVQYRLITDTVTEQFTSIAESSDEKVLEADGIGLTDRQRQIEQILQTETVHATEKPLPVVVRTAELVPPKRQETPVPPPLAELRLSELRPLTKTTEQTLSPAPDYHAAEPVAPPALELGPVPAELPADETIELPSNVSPSELSVSDISETFSKHFAGETEPVKTVSELEPDSAEVFELADIIPLNSETAGAEPAFVTEIDETPAEVLQAQHELRQNIALAFVTLEPEPQREAEDLYKTARDLVTKIRALATTELETGMGISDGPLLAPEAWNEVLEYVEKLESYCADFLELLDLPHDEIAVKHMLQLLLPPEILETCTTLYDAQAWDYRQGTHERKPADTLNISDNFAKFMAAKEEIMAVLGKWALNQLTQFQQQLQVPAI